MIVKNIVKNEYNKACFQSEDIRIFNFQELDVNVKERVDYREMGMMRPERVGGWGGGGY